MGRLEEAIAEDKRALELDPLSLPINAILGVTFYDARQYDQAIEQERKTLELDPNFTLAHIVLGFAYLQKSMYKEGIAEFEKDAGDLPWQHMSAIGTRIRLCGGGQKSRGAEGARSIERTLEAKVCSSGGPGPRIYVGLGEKDKAFEWLEKAFEEPLHGQTLK